MYDGRIIPPSLRKEVLECLHSAHQGTVGMKARARSSVYWPGMSNAITSVKRATPLPLHNHMSL